MSETKGRDRIERMRMAFLKACAKSHPDSEIGMWILFDDEPFQAIIDVLIDQPTTRE